MVGLTGCLSERQNRGLAFPTRMHARTLVCLCQMDVPSTRHAHFEASKAEQRRKQSRQGRWAGRVRQGKQDGQSRQGLQSRQTAQAEQAGRASDARTSLRQGKQDGQSRQCLQSRQTAQAGRAGRASDARTLLATFLFVPWMFWTPEHPVAMIHCEDAL